MEKQKVEPIATDKVTKEKTEKVVALPVTALTFDQLEGIKRGNPFPVLLGKNPEYYTAQLILDLAARTRASLPTPELNQGQIEEIKKDQKVLLDMPLDEMFNNIKSGADIPELRSALTIVHSVYKNLAPEVKAEEEKPDQEEEK